MKKVLGIVGSPRVHGNTHVLVTRVLEAAAQAGAAVDLLLLRDLTIHECDGCHACWKGRDCSKRDDMNAVYPRIIDSDVLVFGTPVYWYGPTALMKAFIDRFVYFNSPENRPKIRGKSAALVIPYEETDPDTAAPLVTFFEKSLRYLEMRLAGKLIVPGVSAKGDALKKSEALREADMLGRTLAG